MNAPVKLRRRAWLTRVSARRAQGNITATEDLVTRYCELHRDLRRQSAALLSATVALYEGASTNVAAVIDQLDVLASAVVAHQRVERDHLFPLLTARSLGFATEVSQLSAGHVEFSDCVEAVSAALHAVTERPGRPNLLANVVIAAVSLHDHFAEQLQREEAAVQSVAPHVLTDADAHALALRVKRPPAPARERAIAC